MEDFLRYLITPLLSTPSDLVLTPSGSSLVIKVSPPDIGRLIGKHGATIQAIRVLLKTYCTTHKLPPVNVVLDSPPTPKTDQAKTPRPQSPSSDQPPPPPA